MAKRYIRVNSGQGWENAPSVATPINKSNLNIMDKGIDDLDLYKIDTDAIANNLVTTEAGLVLDARQGKVLDDKVNTINNNLANIYYKTYSTGDVITTIVGAVNAGKSNGTISFSNAPNLPSGKNGGFVTYHANLALTSSIILLFQWETDIYSAQILPTDTVINWAAK